jgi:cytochrome d ubiquinol oxidase subunit II
MMDLQIIWFILIGILLTGFFVLEGFDYGVGILLPFLGKNDTERRMIINSIGPFWDGNEVWLITAGGAIFAAFPNWYATLFSAFYLQMLGILFGLILRGAAFEFRSMQESRRWRTTWDWAIFTGSTLPSFFAGVILANLLRGIPINAHMDYIGNPLEMWNPYALLTGIAFILLFALHGAIFINLRVAGPLMERSRKAAKHLWLPTILAIATFTLTSYFSSDTFRLLFLNPRIAPIGDLVIVSLLMVGWLMHKKRSGLAFTMTCLTILLAAISISLGIFPNVIISSMKPDWNLTIVNASSSPYTLQVMSWIALTLTPIVLIYQGWSYWIFRKRLQPHAGGHY